MTMRSNDDHLATVVRLTQLEAGRRRSRRQGQSRLFRFRIARVIAPKPSDDDDHGPYARLRLPEAPT